jgi:hypothetical protein
MPDAIGDMLDRLPVTDPVLVFAIVMLIILIAPIAGIVPAQATAPALVIVGFLMFMAARELVWGEIDEQELKKARGNLPKMVNLIHEKTGEDRDIIFQKMSAVI